MMDKKFRLFGKVSIMDIIIVVVIIVGIFMAMKLSVVSNAATAAGSDTQKINYAVLATNKEEEFENNIVVGQKIYDSLKGEQIGVITGYEKHPYTTYQPNLEDGTIVASDVEDRYDYHIYVEANAKISQSAVAVGDYEVAVGKEMFVKTKNFATQSFCIKLEMGGQQ